MVHADEQFTLPKTKAALRTVPMVGELRRVLLEHRLFTGRRDGLVVQRAGGGVESGDALACGAEKAAKAAKVAALTMHESKYTYASLMILARVPITALYSGAQNSCTVALNAAASSWKG